MVMLVYQRVISLGRSNLPTATEGGDNEIFYDQILTFCGLKGATSLQSNLNTIPKK